MKTFYIHAGHQKTGSTSIQEFLFKYRNELYENNNLYIPKTGLMNLKKAIRHHTENKFFDTENFSRLISELHNFRDANYLITDEGLATNSAIDLTVAKKLQAAFPDHSIKVIMYVRRLDDFLSSMLNQSFKFLWKKAYNPTHISFMEHMLTVKHIPTALSKYSSYFGRDNLILKIYDKKYLKNNNSVDDFLDTLNIELSDKYSTDIDSNKHLDQNSLQFLGVWQALFQDERLNNEMYAKIKNIASKVYSSTPFIDELRMEDYKNEINTQIESISEYIPEYKALFSSEPIQVKFPPADTDIEALFLAGLSYQLIHDIDNLTKFTAYLANEVTQLAQEVKQSNKKIAELLLKNE